LVWKKKLNYKAIRSLRHAAIFAHGITWAM